MKNKLKDNKEIIKTSICRAINKSPASTYEISKTFNISWATAALYLNELAVKRKIMSGTQWNASKTSYKTMWCSNNKRLVLE